jgi:beta-glucosidase
MKLKLLILLMSATVFGQNSTSIYLNPNAAVDSRVADLMSQMTLEEKVGQMCQYVGLEYLKKQKRNKKAAGNVSMLNKDAFAMYGLSESEIIQEIIDGKIGSFLHVLEPSEVNFLQDFTLKSRLKIPLIIGIDAIHGNAMVSGTTVYPSPYQLLPRLIMILLTMWPNKVLGK